MPLIKSECWKFPTDFGGEHFWRSDITYGVKKDQNVESLICVTFQVLFNKVIFDVLNKLSTFWSFWLLTNLIILKKLSTFWPFDVVIFNVPTPSPFEYCRRKLSVTEGRIFIFVGLYVGSVSVLTILSKLRTVQNKHWKINC
jgi:hypothetical protein